MGTATASLRSFFRRFGKAAPVSAVPPEFELKFAAETMARRACLARQASIGFGHILIPILPWRNTAVAFFSIEMGAALASRGASVSFMVHDPQLAFHQHATSHEEMRWVRHALAAYANRFSILEVDESSNDFPIVPEDILHRWARENAVWLSKSETAAYGVLETEEACAALQREYGRIHSALSKAKPDFVLIPGGVMGASVCYLAACRALGIPFATYDSGRGEIKLCMDGVAAHNDDLPAAFHYFCGRPGSERAQFRKGARDWVAKRRAGKDDYQLQFQDTAPITRKNFLLICLNYRADTAALLRQRLFPTVREWIVATACWAMERGVELVIRQHPCERLERFRGNDDWAAIVKAADPEGKAVRFVSAHDPVNTYDLLEQAACVLPFTSRIGVESAALGVPVITSTHAFYSGLGFTYDPPDEKSYYSLLRNAVDGRLTVTEKQKEHAQIAYFAISEHTRIRTCFTPQPTDFVTWSVIPPEELWKRTEVLEMLETILKRKPFAVVRHERALARL